MDKQDQHFQGKTSPSIIERFYDEGADEEWERLERHKTEFAVTLRTLTEYLPSAPQAVLDDGGGPGRYTLALASLGYQVTLLDLSAANLAFARQKAVESANTIQHYIHGNALELLSINDKSFDAVVMLGPLYHLLTEDERKTAIREAWRVLRPGGIIFTAFITRYAAFRDLAKISPVTLFEKRSEWEEILRTGILRAYQGFGFTDAYLVHPAEIKPLMEASGFETLDLIGCEGIVATNEASINQLSGEAWQVWVDFNYQAGKEQTLHGASDHLLYVGRKVSP